MPSSTLNPKADAAAPRGRRSRRWLKWFGAVCLVLIALPFVLTVVYRVAPPVSTLMAWRVATSQPVARAFVPIKDMPPALVRAVVASEDSRFCSHWGIDLDAIDDALQRAERRNRPIVGVSTISMQVAKNLFLWHGRSYVRKALEIPLTLWVELVLPKERILEIYLNIAEWGPKGQFGAEAGARAAFGKSVGQLTMREAALMATALPNPILRQPGKASARHRSLAGIIERRAASLGEALECLPAARV